MFSKTYLNFESNFNRIALSWVTELNRNGKLIFSFYMQSITNGYLMPVLLLGSDQVLETDPPAEIDDPLTVTLFIPWSGPSSIFPF